MSKHKSAHRNIHTFRKAYSLAKKAIRELVTDPSNTLDIANANRYKALAVEWARSESELSKATALTLPVA
jgi:hypothetical protein